MGKGCRRQGCSRVRTHFAFPQMSWRRKKLGRRAVLAFANRNPRRCSLGGRGGSMESCPIDETCGNGLAIVSQVISARSNRSRRTESGNCQHRKHCARADKRSGRRILKDTKHARYDTPRRSTAPTITGNRPNATILRSALSRIELRLS